MDVERVNKRCRAEAVMRRRRKTRTTLVAEAGGKCRACGYARHLGALEFHHVDPREKRIELNGNGVALALNTLRAEARECVLLCSNWHSELERGIIAVPLLHSRQARSGVTQLAEYSAVNRGVVGSSPTPGALSR
jgi:hypothetical protein